MNKLIMMQAKMTSMKQIVKKIIAEKGVFTHQTENGNPKN